MLTRLRDFARFVFIVWRAAPDPHSGMEMSEAGRAGGGRQVAAHLPRRVYSARRPACAHCSGRRRELHYRAVRSRCTMIICLSGFVIAGTSPPAGPLPVRNDIVSTAAYERALPSTPKYTANCSDVTVQVSCERMLAARYSPHHQTLLAQLARPGAARSSSSSAESVSSAGASPLPGRAAAWRVRTLYACLGESEGELSFEPNQIITNVSASGEPGWLRGTLNGKTGLVPENYVEPLP